MNDLISHRGPDSAGSFVHDSRIALGMRRLSIIDLVSGDQPMFNHDRKIAIVFNGEIYNFLELKKILLKEGVIFHTTSDTEVILKLYETRGVSAFNLLNGAFSFSIFDSVRGKIFLVRDRFGKKPLYYTAGNGTLIWASELKSILGVLRNYEVSKLSVNMYFALSFIPSPFTVFSEIFKLEPGSYMEINCQTLDYDIRAYWRYDPFILPAAVNYSEAKKLLEELLFDAVEKRMIADVPLGAFLSGGIDSSIVVALMSSVSKTPVRTFSIGFREKSYDESKKAEAVARYCNTIHHTHILLPDELLNIHEDVILNFDEPFGDSSALPTFSVSKLASENVKVVLTGDGGDEAFGGYNRYSMHHYRKLYRRFVPGIVHDRILQPFVNAVGSWNENTKSLSYRIRKFMDAVSDDDFRSIYMLMSLGFNDIDRSVLFTSGNYRDDIKKIIEEIYLPVSSLSYLKKARYLDQRISLEGDMLAKVDRMSMRNSLECRCPFLDFRVMEFAGSLPDTFLIKGSIKKRILRDTFAKMLPEKHFEAPKSGFEVPVGSWLKKELYQQLMKLADSENLASQGIFNHDYLSMIIKEHCSGRRDHSSRLWMFYCFQKWYNKQIFSL